MGIVFIIGVILIVLFANSGQSSPSTSTTPWQQKTESYREYQIRTGIVQEVEVRKKQKQDIKIPEPKRFVKKTPVSKLPEWFCVQDIKPSPAELLIMKELSKYKVRWFREIAFKSFPSSKWGFYRYDFMLPDYQLIIEYDSKKWHQGDKLDVDALKTKFCTDNNIAIRRFGNKHYYKMELTIANLMAEYGIPLA